MGSIWYLGSARPFVLCGLPLQQSYKAFICRTAGQNLHYHPKLNKPGRNLNYDPNSLAINLTNAQPTLWIMQRYRLINSARTATEFYHENHWFAWSLEFVGFMTKAELTQNESFFSFIFSIKSLGDNITLWLRGKVARSRTRSNNQNHINYSFGETVNWSVMSHGSLGKTKW